MERVGLVVRGDSPEAQNLADQAAAFLREKGVEPLLSLTGEETPGPDMIWTFGGDGTLLSGAHLALRWDCPLLGINLGTVGFLTEVEPESMGEAIERVLRGDYTLERRSLLTVENPKTGERFLALNDAVVTRGGYARLIRVESSINGEKQDIFTADGVIVATPTGSTGYSLSAGGPIVEPSMNCMVITPVCAHSLHHCPVVVSSQSEIRLRLLQERMQTAELQIDGQNRGLLAAGDEIWIRGTERQMRLIRLQEGKFFHLTRRKLMEWGSNEE